MSARETVQDYYDALREGEPLAPFFTGSGVEDDPIVKYGISERLEGIDEVEAGLREQTATTADWAVDSRELRVTERDCHAWFSDDVFMAWTDTERSIRFEFDTRWSGTLERLASEELTEESERENGRPAWRFVGMHVSTADDL